VGEEEKKASLLIRKPRWDGMRSLGRAAKAAEWKGVVRDVRGSAKQKLAGGQSELTRRHRDEAGGLAVYCSARRRRVLLPRWRMATAESTRELGRAEALGHR